MSHPEPTSKPGPSSWRRRRWIIALVLLGAYIALMTAPGCADRLILFPSTEPISTPGMDMRMVPFGEGQLQLFSLRTRACGDGPPGAYVLSISGNAARAEYAGPMEAVLWRDQPVEVWALNPPGYGQSTGPARLDALGPAALAAYDAIARSAQDRPIYLSGNSIGTAVALHVARERPVAGLLLQNPPPLRELILGRFGWWNLWLLAGPIAWQVPAELDSLGNARELGCPALFLLASDDQVVPPGYQRRVVGAYGGRHRSITLQGNDHNTPFSEQQLQKVRDGLQWLVNEPS